MDLELVAADLRIGEHRARVALAERFGRHIPIGAGATARGWIVVVAVRRAAGEVGRRAEGLLSDSRPAVRSQEHELALRGGGRATDTADDVAMAAEMSAARCRRAAERLGARSVGAGVGGPTVDGSVGDAGEAVARGRIRFRRLRPAVAG